MNRKPHLSSRCSQTARFAELSLYSGLSGLGMSVSDMRAVEIDGNLEHQPL